MDNDSLNLIRRRLAQINGIKLSDEKKINHEQLVPGAKEADFDKKLADLGAAIDRTMTAHDIRPTKSQAPNTTASSEKSNSQTTNSSQSAGWTIHPKTSWGSNYSYSQDIGKPLPPPKLPTAPAPSRMSQLPTQEKPPDPSSRNPTRW